MKSTTKWYQDIAWLVSLISIILWPVGFVFGCCCVGIGAGYKAGINNFVVVNKEWKRVREISKEKTLWPKDLQQKIDKCNHMADKFIREAEALKGEGRSKS